MPNLRILLLVSSLLAGCASAPNGPLFSPAPNPPNGYALLYVYRPYTQALSSIPVFLNGIRAVALPEEGYTWLYVEPGQYVVTTRPLAKSEQTPQDALKFSVSADRRYYLGRYTTHAKLGKIGLTFVPLPGFVAIAPYEQHEITSTWNIRDELLSEPSNTFELQTLYQVNPETRYIKVAPH